MPFKTQEESHMIGELLKSGTGRDGMGRFRILNYGTGLDTKT